MTSTDVANTAQSDIYYDPYDFTIDADPYPVWKRMRDEAPLYYNSKYDFYAVTRFEDVDRVASDWKTFSSAKGTVLELIRSDFKIPPGNPLFEDPPEHDVHRELLKKVFRPRTIAELELKIREFAAQSLDQFVGTGGFDFITDIGTWVPMRSIGYLLGIPEQDQQKIRHMIDEGLTLSEDGAANSYDPRRGCPPRAEVLSTANTWTGAPRTPSDDLMTELIQAGVRRRRWHTQAPHPRRDSQLCERAFLGGQRNRNAHGRVDGQTARREPRSARRARRRPEAHPERGRRDPALRGAIADPVPCAHR